MQALVLLVEAWICSAKERLWQTRETPLLKKAQAFAKGISRPAPTRRPHVVSIGGLANG